MRAHSNLSWHLDAVFVKVNGETHNLWRTAHHEGEALEGPRRMYLPKPGDTENPLAAPMFAESHVGLPPASIAVAENDPLRDDGKDYAAKLIGSGVNVTFDAGEGLIHGYLRAMDYCAASGKKLKKMGVWLAEQNVE